jgi:hypothetical protein
LTSSNKILPSVSLAITGQYTDKTKDLLENAALAKIFLDIVYVYTDECLELKSLRSTLKEVTFIRGTPYLMNVDMGPKSQNLRTFAANLQLACQSTTSELILRMRSDTLPKPQFFNHILSAYRRHPDKILVLDYHHLTEPFVCSDYIHLCTRQHILKAAGLLNSGDGLLNMILSIKSKKYVYSRNFFFINETAITVSLICTALDISPSSFNWSSMDDWNYYRHLLFCGIDCSKYLIIPYRLRLFMPYNIKAFVVSRVLRILYSLGVIQ